MLRRIPLLRRGASVTRAGESATIRHLDRDVVLDGPAAQLFDQMLPWLDGERGMEEIAVRIGSDPARVRALAERLSRLGVLALRAAGPAEPRRTTGEEFHALHRRHAAHWLRPVYEHPIWEEMASGRATRAQVIGFAFEKYHYIEAAHEHMGIAAANATPEMMPHLARHFIEEFAHGDIYRAGLRHLYADDVILASQPISSTRALVNFLNETAARSSFAYYAGNEVLQMTENTSEDRAGAAIDSLHDALKRHYRFAAPLVDSFVAHTRADQKLGHEDVFLQMCRSVPPLSARDVADAMNVARSMAEHLVLFLDGIREHYARFPTVPRLPCELLAE